MRATGRPRFAALLFAALAAIALRFLGAAQGAEDVAGATALCQGKPSSLVLESPGDAVLTVFLDNDYGAECNVTRTKSIQEMAAALFVVENLNKLEYVPGVKIGLRFLDAGCSDQPTSRRRSLASALLLDDCPTTQTYDLGVLVAEHHGDRALAPPLRSLQLSPVATYTIPHPGRAALVDALVDSLAERRVGQGLVHLLRHGAGQRGAQLRRRFLAASARAGLCVRASLAGRAGTERTTKPSIMGNATSGEEAETPQVYVAIGDRRELSGWLREEKRETERVWILLPTDDSYADDLPIPDASYIIQPDRGPRRRLAELATAAAASSVASTTPTASTSPHLLGVGRAVAEIARALGELRIKSCGIVDDGGGSCPLPQGFQPEGRRSMSNAELYETLRLPAESRSIRYLLSRKIDSSTIDLATYKIDPTSLPYRAIAETVELPKLSGPCSEDNAKNCQETCVNFGADIQYDIEDVYEHPPVYDYDEDDDDDDSFDLSVFVGSLKPAASIPIILTIVALGSLVCLLVLGFLVYRYLTGDCLEGNPSLTIVLALAALLMLQSAVPFCLEDGWPEDASSRFAERLNARKILVSGLSLGLGLSVMLTRALFLAFSTRGSLVEQHISGYLQGFMLLFVAGVEVAIALVFFAMNEGGSARIMRSPDYIILLAYDIFLLALLFVVSCFAARVKRNYREGASIFATSLGLLVLWACWLACFVLVPAGARDAMVCYGILGTACLVVLGILVPRTYLMCGSGYARRGGGAGAAGGFEPGDLGPDPRMNGNAARQSRQPLYEYVGPGNGCSTVSSTAAALQQVQPPSPTANYYASGSPRGGYNTKQKKKQKQPKKQKPQPKMRRQYSPEPGSSPPGYSNYGFRSEMREVEGSPKVERVPRVNVDDSDSSTVVDLYLEDGGVGARPRPGGRQLHPGAQEPDEQLPSLSVRGKGYLRRDGGLRSGSPRPGPATPRA